MEVSSKLVLVLSLMSLVLTFSWAMAASPLGKDSDTIR